MHCDPPIASQLVLFLWQIVEIGPLGHVRVTVYILVLKFYYYYDLSLEKNGDYSNWMVVMSKF
jgi:hypothetical protein